MEGYDFVAHERTALETSAAQAMYDCLNRSSEPVTLVTIGPLTNVALLLTLYPQCKKQIKHLVMMGGSSGRGNFTPNAEFNMAIDPEAAARVFDSGIDIVMCGLDVTNEAVLTPDYLATLPGLNRTGAMLHALFSHYRSGSMATGLRMHDLCAIAYLVKPTLFTLQHCFVAVETQGEYTAGTTVVDLQHRLHRPANAQVALALDVAGFRAWVAQVLALAP
jgi:non-specific riboncleoside hydrolase